MAKAQPTKSTRMVHSFVKSTDISYAPEKLFKSIASAIGKKCHKNKEALETALKSRKNKGPVVLVIDEIDFLCKPKTNKQNEESVLHTIFRWAADFDNRLVVIGISNSVGDDIAKSIHRSAKVSGTTSRKFFISNPVTNLQFLLKCRFKRK